MKPSLKPLSSAELHRMMADADLVASGAITCATLSKTWQGPLETVLVEATLRPDRIIKGNAAADAIEIKESYQQISMKGASGDSRSAAKGPRSGSADSVPPVGRYLDGVRVLAFLKSSEGSKQYRPLGSGSQDAYLGLFQITPEGVKSDRYRFDEAVAGHASTEAAFIDFVVSVFEE